MSFVYLRHDEVSSDQHEENPASVQSRGRQRRHPAVFRLPPVQRRQRQRRTLDQIRDPPAQQREEHPTIEHVEDNGYQEFDDYIHNQRRERPVLIRDPPVQQREEYPTIEHVEDDEYQEFDDFIYNQRRERQRRHPAVFRLPPVQRRQRQRRTLNQIRDHPAQQREEHLTIEHVEDNGYQEFDDYIHNQRRENRLSMRRREAWLINSGLLGIFERPMNEHFSDEEEDIDYSDIFDSFKSFDNPYMF